MGSPSRNAISDHLLHLAAHGREQQGMQTRNRWLCKVCGSWSDSVHKNNSLIVPNRMKKYDRT